eukprot:TRINITY_DN1445_c1_g1_i11.p1 TRINITY_DN1445_c1_g1~~TRINITY_DN1445_c1_g1_i11.p1  ORF type:complete len:196 (-),score=47.33 TRINITY_DN1445_c1_g1_i11:396-983(-)
MYNIFAITIVPLNLVNFFFFEFFFFLHMQTPLEKATKLLEASKEIHSVSDAIPFISSLVDLIDANIGELRGLFSEPTIRTSINASHIVELLVKVIEAYITDSDTCETASRALRHLFAEPKIRTSVNGSHIVGLVVRVIEAHITNSKTCESASFALCNAFLESKIRTSVDYHHIAELLVRVLETHITNSKTCPCCF